MKICRLCLIKKPLTEYYRNARLRGGFFHECKACVRIRRRASHLKRTYGISRQEHDALYLQQKGTCAICGRKGKRLNIASRWPGVNRVYESGLYVDHDHKTGVVRGLLCDTCNRGLGYFSDNPDLLNAAFVYLAMRLSREMTAA